MVGKKIHVCFDYVMNHASIYSLFVLYRLYIKINFIYEPMLPFGNCKVLHKRQVWKQLEG